jgi:hypothetical protein
MSPKLEAEGQGSGKSEPVGLGDDREIDLSEEYSQEIPGRDPDQQAGVGQETLPKPVEKHRHQQDGCGQPQVDQRSVVLGVLAAGGIIHSHRDQSQTDEHHHDAVDQGREQALEPHDREAEEDLDQRRRQTGSEDHGHTVLTADPDPRRDEGDAGAHDDRDLPSHRSQGIGLDDRRNARHDQHRLQHQSRVARRHSDAAGNDQRHRHVAQQHGQHVLEPQREGFPERWAVVDPVDDPSPGWWLSHRSFRPFYSDGVHLPGLS